MFNDTTMRLLMKIQLNNYNKKHVINSIQRGAFSINKAHHLATISISYAYSLAFDDFVVDLV